MTASPATDLTDIDFLAPGCGPDCIVIDGACCCYAGRTVSPEPVFAWEKELIPPY